MLSSSSHVFKLPQVGPEPDNIGVHRPGGSVAQQLLWEELERCKALPPLSLPFLPVH